jgi:hypothetical protein
MTAGNLPLKFTPRKQLIGLLVIALAFALLIFSSTPRFTTYRADDLTWSGRYNKYCGYMIRCQYYSDSTLGIELIQHKDNDDRDYYYTYEGNHCTNELSVKSITANFVNRNVNLNIQHVGTGNDYEAKISPEVIAANQKIELHINFTDIQPEKTLILNRNTDKNYSIKDTQILMLLAAVIVGSCAIWLLVSHLISKTVGSYSPLKRRTLSGVITIILFAIAIKFLWHILFGC